MKLYFLFFILGLSQQPLLACTCLSKPEVKGAIEEADVVFVGKIIESEDVGLMKFTAIVETKYKGLFPTNLVSIYTGKGGGDCGYRFQVGQEYIIYGLYSNISFDFFKMFFTKIITSSCSRTFIKHDEEIIAIEQALCTK